MANKSAAVSLAIYCPSSQPQRQHYATQLAEQLQLPIISHHLQSFPYILTVTDTHLELRFPTTNYKPMCVDFLSKALEYRRLQGGGKEQLIARAVGIKGKY